MCSRASKTESEWTIGARSSVSFDKDLDKSSVWSRAPSDISLYKPPKVAGSKGGSSSSRGSLNVPGSGSLGVGGSEGKVVFNGRSNRRGDALPTTPLPSPRVLRRSHADAEVKVPKSEARVSCKRKLTSTESEASQDLSGCVEEQPAKRIYRAVDCRREGNSFPVKCPLCPHKTSVAVRKYLRNHYAKHHRGVELPKPLPRRKASYLNLVRVQESNALIHWKRPLCPMAMLKEDSEQMCEFSVAKHKAQHKRTHHPKTWRKLDYESRAAKGVRTKLSARTSDSFGDIAEMKNLGFNFLWWPRAKGFCKNLKQQSCYIARMRPAWVCQQCGNALLSKKEAVEHAKRVCPFLHPKSTLNIKWCRSLLKRRIRVLAKLRDKFCASAPASDRKKFDLDLFDKALDHFGSFRF